jgi:hypothetical protein
MADEDKDSSINNVNSTIDAITGLVKAVPVYQDAIQPSTKQIGQSLETVTKTVNIALAPIKALVWGYEKIEVFINTRVSEKLKNVPEENIVSPPPEVAGPAVEALRYSGYNENLRELYANLLATAMDKDSIQNAHPSFVEILKNISSDEATLLQAFLPKSQYPVIDIVAKSKDTKGYSIVYANYSHLHKTTTLSDWLLTPTYLNNLCRLGILEIPALTTATAPNSYEPLETDDELKDLKAHIESFNRTAEYKRKLVRLTSFGKLFIQSVVKEKS